MGMGHVTFCILKKNFIIIFHVYLFTFSAYFKNDGEDAKFINKRYNLIMPSVSGYYYYTKPNSMTFMTRILKTHYFNDEDISPNTDAQFVAVRKCVQYTFFFRHNDEGQFGIYGGVLYYFAVLVGRATRVPHHGSGKTLLRKKIRLQVQLPFEFLNSAKPAPLL